MASGRLLVVAVCAVLALFAVKSSEAHGLEDFTGGGNTGATMSPAMESFFGAKPEAAALPEALGASTTRAAKPEAASAIPTTTTTTASSTSGGSAARNDDRAPAPRRSVSAAAGVAWGVAAVAVVGVAAAVAYVVRAARREAPGAGAVQLGSAP